MGRPYCRWWHCLLCCHPVGSSGASSTPSARVSASSAERPEHILCIVRTRRMAQEVVGTIKAYGEVVTVVPCAAGVVYPLPADAAWIVEIRPWLSQSITVHRRRRVIDVVWHPVMPACPRCSKAHSAYVADLYGGWGSKVGRRRWTSTLPHSLLCNAMSFFDAVQN